MLLQKEKTDNKVGFEQASNEHYRYKEREWNQGFSAANEQTNNVTFIYLVHLGFALDCFNEDM